MAGQISFGAIPISFVIPTLNEADDICETLHAIRQVAAGIPHDIIVVDNGSTDGTVDIVRPQGVKCLVAPGVTIGRLRNLGAQHAKSEILVFLDADVRLQPEWGRAIPTVIQALRNNPRLITGSRCVGSAVPPLIERAWISTLTANASAPYINSGHCVVHRSLFHEMGGFSETLETGEDYEFCARTRKAGAQVLNNPDLVAIHDGYPRTLAAFFRRERWHGRGDAATLGTFLHSKPAVLGVIQLGILAAVLTWAPLVLLLPWLALWTFLAGRRSRVPGLELFTRTGLYAIYLTARGVAIFDVLFGRLRKRFRLMHASDLKYRVPTAGSSR